MKANNVYERVRNARLNRGLSQLELAEKLGLTSKAAVSKIENGKCDISTTKLNDIANILGVSPVWLLTGDEVSSEIKNKYNELSDITSRMVNDKEFQELIKKIMKLSPAQIKALMELVNTML